MGKRMKNRRIDGFTNEWKDKWEDELVYGWEDIQTLLLQTWITDRNSWILTVCQASHQAFYVSSLNLYDQPMRQEYQHEEGLGFLLKVTVERWQDYRIQSHQPPEPAILIAKEYGWMTPPGPRGPPLSYGWSLGTSSVPCLSLTSRPWVVLAL